MNAAALTGRTVRLVLLAAPLALAACGDMPRLSDLRDLRPSAMFNTRSPAPPPPSAARGDAEMGQPSASAAEAACVDAGRAAGFDVRGVVGTAEVADATGATVSRDVMLSVQRGGRDLQVRCSYSYASASAQIMTL